MVFVSTANCQNVNATIKVPISLQDRYTIEDISFSPEININFHEINLKDSGKNKFREWEINAENYEYKVHVLDINEEFTLSALLNSRFFFCFDGNAIIENGIWQKLRENSLLVVDPENPVVICPQKRIQLYSVKQIIK